MRRLAGIALHRLGLLRRAPPDGTRTPNARIRAVLEAAMAGPNAEQCDSAEALLGEAGPAPAHEARLSPEESARVARRVARVRAQAEDAFQDAAKAGAWLRRPSRALEGRVPLDLLNTELGARLVEDELTRISYGVYS
jgi:hypothetical protein